jgi:predicted O-methyltransferase YrrM
VRYFYHRTLDKVYQRLHPDEPWLTPEANRLLDQALRPDFNGLEFGSGRSTLWFAARLGKLTSVEHNPEWYDRVKHMLAERGISNVEYVLAPENEKVDGQPAYALAADRFAGESLDFILIDGILRDDCVNRALPKLRPGGMLVIDDVHRYLPSDSIAPYARTRAQGPVSEGWRQFMEKTAAWKCIWSQNGVSDTAIFYKPLMAIPLP